MCAGSGPLGAGLEDPAVERVTTGYRPTDEASIRKGVRVGGQRKEQVREALQKGHLNSR